MRLPRTAWWWQTASCGLGLLGSSVVGNRAVFLPAINNATAVAQRSAGQIPENVFISGHFGGVSITLSNPNFSQQTKE